LQKKSQKNLKTLKVLSVAGLVESVFGLMAPKTKGSIVVIAGMRDAGVNYS